MLVMCVALVRLWLILGKLVLVRIVEHVCFDFSVVCILLIDRYPMNLSGRDESAV